MESLATFNGKADILTSLLSAASGLVKARFRSGRLRGRRSREENFAHPRLHNSTAGAVLNLFNGATGQPIGTMTSVGTSGGVTKHSFQGTAAVPQK